MPNSYNIPTVTTGQVVELFTDLYCNAYQTGTLSKVPSAALWGPFGVGKSTAVYAIAAGLEAGTGRRVIVTDIRLLNFSPVDLRGIPSADAAREFTVWLKPKIFDLEEDAQHILFLDEMLSETMAEIRDAMRQAGLPGRGSRRRCSCSLAYPGRRERPSSVGKSS